MKKNEGEVERKMKKKLKKEEEKLRHENREIGEEGKWEERRARKLLLLIE